MKVVLSAVLVLALCVLGVLSMLLMTGTAHASAGMFRDPPPPTDGASYILPPDTQPTDAAPGAGTATNGVPNAGSSTNGSRSPGSVTNGR
ncbi:MAG TPA: hypothetical protein VF458_21240 [Ktedonobacteraceae bacterium]